MKLILIILSFISLIIFVFSLILNNKKGYKLTTGKIISVVGHKKLISNKANDIFKKYFKKNNTAISNLVFNTSRKNRIIICYSAKNNDYYTFKPTNKKHVKNKNILLKYNVNNPQVIFFFNFKLIIISGLVFIFLLILYLII